MDTNRLPRQALHYRPKGLRNIGRPRNRWRDQLHFEDQGTGNMPNPSWTWWWWWWWWCRCESVVSEKKALHYGPKGRRNIGRPRNRWRDQLHFEDQGTGNMPNPSRTWWWWWWWWCRCAFVVSEKKVPIISLALITHHAPTTSWMNISKVFFWDFTYPLQWKQVSSLNRTSVMSTSPSRTPRRYQLTNLPLASWYVS